MTQPDHQRKRPFSSLMLNSRRLIPAMALLLASCANIVAPSGGPADREPPRFVRAVPEYRSAMFEGDKLLITFHEFVNLNDAVNQVVVSPPLEKIPDFRTRGKTVIVVFNEKLRENTTYTVNFGNTIRDITENNETASYRFAFSTGTYVDSLSLKGILRNAYTAEPEKSVLIMLYGKPYDSIPYKEKPEHITITDAAGNFVFENLPAGKFMIFALKDANSNLLFDQPTEAVAFLDEIITPAYIAPPDTSARNDSLRADTVQIPAVKPASLRLFVESDTVQRLLKERADQPGQFQLIFRQAAQNIEFRFLKKQAAEGWNLLEYNKGRDTLTCWVTDLKTDSVFAEVKQEGIVVDTIQIGLKSPQDTLKTQRGRAGKGTGARSQGFRLSLGPNVGNDAKLGVYQKLLIQFSHPIHTYDFSCVTLTEKADSSGQKMDPLIRFSDTAVKRNLAVEYPWKSNTKYELFIPPKCFTDIFGLTNDTLTIQFTTTSPDDYGILKINIRGLNTDNHYIIHLLDEKGNTLSEKTFTGMDSLHVFNFLKPGIYRARLIYDSNANGKWDSGRYLQKIQPEKVYYLSSPATLRANWDTEIDWELLQ